MENQIATQVRQILAAHKREIETLQREVVGLRATAPKKSHQDEIESIPGRRIFYMLVGQQTFTTANDGARGNPINMLVSQDGPYVMTGFPFAIWRPSAPSNATDLGRWRAVSSWPLPAETLTTNIVDLSYEIADAGSQRNFQNLAIPPLFSRPDRILPLPIPTLFAPNTTVQFIPTYQNILFGGSTAATEGTLVVALPGYRIVNM